MNSFSRCTSCPFLSGQFASVKTDGCRRRSCQARCRQAPLSKVGLLLWLSIWPCHGVQIWQQGTVQGQPVFTTSGVREATHLRDIQPARVPNAPIVEPLLRAGPMALRTICVYRLPTVQQPTVLVVDDRAHGRLLCRMVCSAYGLSDADWHLRRLVESLPSLPTEQYVMSPVSLAWNLIQVPVDLRPLGGRIMLLTTGRCSSCGEVAEVAIQEQHLGPCPVFLCRTSQGWFHPTAKVLLLPFGDAFQVWPMNQAAVSSVAVEDTEGRPPTLEDRFSTSLSLPSVGELAYHDLSGANAVILHLHGHTYACLPSYADHLTLRSAALNAVAADLRILARGRLLFARMLPPLDRLPAIQFVAAYCDGEDVMGVVDLRPSGGGAYVIQVPPGSTPAERISCAVQSYGEPDPEHPLYLSLAQGLLHVMHRERVVDPFAPLDAAIPAPIVVTRRHSHVGAGYVDPNLPAEDLGLDTDPAVLGGSSDVSACSPSRISRWVVIGVIVLLRPQHAVHPSLLCWGLLGMVASAVQLPESSGLVSGSMGTPWHVARQVPNLASVAEHGTLGRSLAYIDARTVLGVALDDNAGLPAYQFCVWSPGERICFLIDGDASPVVYRERLLEIKAALDRGVNLPWDPQPFDRCVHMVSVAKDRALVTVIADTGREYIYLEVSRARPGPSILTALQAIYPSYMFRLGDSIRSPIRDGDVIRVFSDQPAATADPQFLIPQLANTPLAADSQQIVYVISVDMGLLRLTVPYGVSVWTLERALIAWLGRQRCLGVRLTPVDLANTPPVFCLPRRGRSTLVVALVDLVDSVLDPVITVADEEGPQELDCGVLREPWRPASLFWNEVLERGPVCVACWTASSSAPTGGPPVRHITLGLDVCRALSTGWRSPILRVIPSYDLVQGAARQGIDWGWGPSPVYGQDASTQTVASHWRMRASPLFSDAMPVPRRAAGCSFNSRYGSEGTLFHLDCPQMHVRCTIPCVVGRHIWALRIGNWVHAACTPRIGWDEILEVAGLSFWDLPGTSIHGSEHVWTWPDDVESLSGRCGHVMHEGSDPCLECIRFDDGVSAPVQAQQSVSSAAPGRSWALGFLLLMSGPDWRMRLLVAASLMSMGSSSSEEASSSHAQSALNSSGWPEDTPDDMHPARGDATRTCTVAWCHELSCQTTHFATTPVALADYFSRYAPAELVRVHLWLPFQGPALFDLSREAHADTLSAKLQAAGHDPSRHSLFVAFDSQPTVVDLISVPPGGSRWWIVRDGLSRELLRPVTTWVEDHRRAVVTLNSHGQVASLVATLEVAGMYHLPHGARGTTATPLTRVYGYLADSGLVLSEASIGVSLALSRLSGRWGLTFAVLLSSLPVGQAMMQEQLIITRPQVAWNSPQGNPQHSCIWTHTLAAPVVLPYADPPDPGSMSTAVAATGRGVRSDGLFAWTNPRQWGDSAHIIHYPAGVCPPCVFWLVHYRGRGAVVCATPGPLDWQYLAQESAEAFATPSFLQRTFGIPQFEYNICRGPRGESPIRPQPVPRQASATTCTLRDDIQASVSYFQHLLGGFEQSVERCHGVASRLEAVESEAAIIVNSEPTAVPASENSAASPLGSELLAAFLACFWAQTLPMPFSALACSLGGAMLVARPTYAAGSGTGEPDGPTEPSSPDLEDLQAPTPTGTIEHGHGEVVGVVQRPGHTPFSRTSAPLRGDTAPPIHTFDAAQIPSIQRRVAACMVSMGIPSCHMVVPSPCIILSPVGRNAALCLKSYRRRKHCVRC